MKLQTGIWNIDEGELRMAMNWHMTALKTLEVVLCSDKVKSTFTWVTLLNHASLGENPSMQVYCINSFSAICI